MLGYKQQHCNINTIWLSLWFVFVAYVLYNKPNLCITFQ